MSIWIAVSYRVPKLLGYGGVQIQTSTHLEKTFLKGAMLYTKRNSLMKIASLFDPIGFLAPYTVRAKMLLQDM